MLETVAKDSKQDKDSFELFQSNCVFMCPVRLRWNYSYFKLCVNENDKTLLFSIVSSRVVDPASLVSRQVHFDLILI